MSPQKSKGENLELPFSGAAAPADSATRTHQLSKSRFTAGSQCHRLLWWKVHEPMAVELQPDKVLQDRFDQGSQVGALARELFPGGTLIDVPYKEYERRVAETATAMATNTPAIFEASFVADGVFVAVDVLLRQDDAWTMIEVKSSSSRKEEHLLDAAIQLHVLTKCGVDVRSVEIMHLNKECHFPDLSNLLTRAAVTSEVRALLPGIPAEIESQLAMLAGALPTVAIGLHCHEPYACPFMERCWPQDADHISKLYNVGPKKCDGYMKAGVHRIADIPEAQKKKLPPAARRQLRAMDEGRLVVEDGLAEALEPFKVRLGFLDFETIQRAVPVWPGTAPWEQSAAQFSYHEARPDGTYAHVEFLAEGAEDARPRLAERMLAATKDAERVVTYSAFEKTKIRALQAAVPDLAAPLKDLEAKLIDLLPVIRENVYHPAFHGSFSLKAVLPAMVPGVSYSDLVIVDGLVASVEIARLLFVAGKIPDEERNRVRQDLLEYCERDTWAMVKLMETLSALVT